MLNIKKGLDSIHDFEYILSCRLAQKCPNSQSVYLTFQITEASTLSSKYKPESI